MVEGPKKIAILGSTGSIGTQTLEVIEQHPNRFQVEVLTAQNSADLLIEQALKWNPAHVLIGNESHYLKVKQALAARNIEVHTGSKSL